MSRLVTVKCPICGRVIKTRGKYFFRCCGIGLPINAHIITENFALKNLKKNRENPQENTVSEAKNEDSVTLIIKENKDYETDRNK